MRFINSSFTDAGFNLAAEEYLLKQGTEDVFMLWQSAPSVIIGKHQRVETEVNRTMAEQNKIPVFRRFPVAVPYITIWATSILRSLKLPVWRVSKLIWSERLKC